MCLYPFNSVFFFFFFFSKGVTSLEENSATLVRFEV